MSATGTTAGERYRVSIGSNRFPHDLSNTQVVYHGVNKSGSMAMNNAMAEAYANAGRQDEFLSHYRLPMTDAEFRIKVDALNGRRAFVVDHYLFGALAPCPNRVWLTTLRHPLPRILSFYQWVKNIHIKKHGSAEGFESLSDYVRNTTGLSGSQIAQFGCGYGPHARRRHGFARKDLHATYLAAIDAMEANFYAIGIAEYFEESLFVFAAVCGIDSVVPWKRDNRNPGRPLADEISDSEKALIEETFHYDYELYRFAVKRFHEQNQRLGLIESDLAAYKAACADQYKDRLLLDSVAGL